MKLKNKVQKLTDSFNTLKHCNLTPPVSYYYLSQTQ